MEAEPNYETQRINHLGIVAGVCQEISLIEQINSQVRNSEREVSCGQGTQAMILNALGFVGRALYLTPGYLDNKPVDVLIGGDVRAADFNDDTLARCLDDLYEAGVTECSTELRRMRCRYTGSRRNMSIWIAAVSICMEPMSGKKRSERRSASRMGIRKITDRI